MADIKVVCPDCGTAYKVPSTALGKRVKCKKCGEVFEAEAAEATPPPSEPEDDFGFGNFLADEIGAASERAVPETPREMCPSCGGPMDPGIVVCVSCGHNKQTGKKLETTVARPAKPARSQPRGGGRPVATGGGLPITVIIPALAVLLNLVLNIGAIALADENAQVKSASFCCSSVPTGIGLLIFVGILKGSRLAWQWGVVICGLGAFFTLLIGMFALPAIREQSGGEVPLLSYWLLLMPWLIFVPFMTKSARAYFGLVCPNCGSYRAGAVGFFFTSAVCKRCKTCY